MVMAAAVVSSNAAAQGQGSLSDTVTFRGLLIVSVPPTEAKAGAGSIVAKNCTVSSDGEESVPCTLVGTSQLTFTGGTVTGSVSSSDGVIYFQSTFAFANPDTGLGSGTAREFDFDDRAWTSATTTGSMAFTPTTLPKIYNDSGTLRVIDNPDQPGDPDSGCKVTAAVSSAVC